jgi:Arc/MetJ-type ribon-helix-helix transcriptional regulator
MAAPASKLSAEQAIIAELQAFAAPYLSSREYADITEVLHAALAALRREKNAEDRICEALAEEGEASGLYEGDPFERIRARYGWKTRFTE